MTSTRSKIRNAVAALRGQEASIEEDRNQPRTTRGGTVVQDDDSNPTSSGPIGPFDPAAAGLEEDTGGPKAKILRYAEKHNWRWLGRAMQVQSRYGELQGSNVASAVTLQIFLSLFPLLIIASSAIGFFVRNAEEDVTETLTESLGITDPSVQKAISNAVEASASGAGLAAIVGAITLLWSALGVSSALQFAYNQAWQAHGRGVKDKAVGLGWLIGAGILISASAGSSVVGNWLPGWLAILTTIAGFAFMFAFWMFTSTLLPNVNLSWRTVVPGAIVATVGLETIKQLALLVPGAASSSESGAYGAFGAALALIAALFILGKLVVYSAVINVVLYEAKSGTSSATIDVPLVTATSASDNDNDSDENDKAKQGS